MPAVRDTTINIRARRSQQELIDRAARLAGRNRSDFMLEAACERAQHLLLDRSFFGLDGKAYRRFLKMLDEPARLNAALKRLLASRSPWER
ncbi:MAG: toxin-antitoxin system protein [Betaproteobacteria bacterium RIFCSPLOWO2_12_FULL_62_58]|nr:MAG: toxin-antitoxin system protein [Betaproteobacteria bacterium RIFCSPLOWO2_12_FULL_62_58]